MLGLFSLSNLTSPRRRLSHRLSCATAIALVLLLRVNAAVGVAGDIRVEVDGKPVAFEAAPKEIRGVVVVPMRGIFERLGAVVNYDDVTHTVKALRGTTLILLRLGSDTAMVNLKQHHLQVPAFSQQGHIMVPLRFVSEALGARVSWNAQSRVVSIMTLQAVIPSPKLPAPSAPETPLPPSGTTTAPEAAIKEFRHNATGTLHPGDTLTVTMVGTPGGQASFSVPGVSDKVALPETSAGTYTVDYKIPTGVSTRLAPVYGMLQVGTQRAPLTTAATPLTIQPLTPHVERPEPLPGATVAEKTPRITGFFEMVGGTLDPGSVRVSVNGIDVTKQAFITREFFTYMPPQPLTGHVSIAVSGRSTTPPATVPQDWSDSWEFDVQGSAVKIQSATHGPQSVYKPSDLLEVTMVGTAGGTATFDIGTFRAAMPMHESSAGMYVGSYRVAAGDRVERAPLVVRLRVGTEMVAAQVPISVTLGVGMAGEGAVPLTVTSPLPGDTVGKDILVRGQTVAAARVKVDLLGHLPLVEHDVRVTGAEGTADAQGSYTVIVHVPLALSGMSYTLVVTSTDAAGNRARPVQTSVKIK